MGQRRSERGGTRLPPPCVCYDVCAPVIAPDRAAAAAAAAAAAHSSPVMLVSRRARELTRARRDEGAPDRGGAGLLLLGGCGVALLADDASRVGLSIGTALMDEARECDGAAAVGEAARLAPLAATARRGEGAPECGVSAGNCGSAAFRARGGDWHARVRGESSALCLRLGGGLDSDTRRSRCDSTISPGSAQRPGSSSDKEEELPTDEEAAGAVPASDGSAMPLDDAGAAATGAV